MLVALQETYFTSDNSCTCGNKGMQFLQSVHQSQITIHWQIVAERSNI